MCAPFDPVCAAHGVAKAAASGILADIANGIKGGVLGLLGSLGAVWTQISTPSLTQDKQTPVAQTDAGRAELDTLLGYLTWIGFAIAIIGVILLGITVALTARRGDGQGLVNKLTITFGGVTLIGAAGPLTSFLVPTRQGNLNSAVAFVQDQTVLLQLFLFMGGIVFAGVKMAVSQEGRHGRDLAYSVMRMAIVCAAGVTLINTLTLFADHLATGIIRGSTADFSKDVQKLMGFTEQGADDKGWLLGNFGLIVIGGTIAIIVNFVQILLMVARIVFLVLAAGIFPMAASFTHTETGKKWFDHLLGWTVGFIFYKPAAALVYGVGLKLSTMGMWDAGGDSQSIFFFAGGLMCLVGGVVALPVLIRFISPVMGAVASGSGAAGGMAGAMAGQALPSGARKLGQAISGGGNRGSTASSGQPNPSGSTNVTGSTASGGKTASSAAGKTGATGSSGTSGAAATSSGAGGAAAGAGAAAATGGVAAGAAVAAKAGKAASDAVSSGVSEAAGAAGEESQSGSSNPSGPSGSGGRGSGGSQSGDSGSGAGKAAGTSPSGSGTNNPQSAPNPAGGTPGKGPSGATPDKGASGPAVGSKSSGGGSKPAPPSGAGPNAAGGNRASNPPSGSNSSQSRTNRPINPNSGKNSGGQPPTGAGGGK